MIYYQHIHREHGSSSTIQYNTIQYNTIQYNTIQYNTIQYNTIQYNTIQYNTIQYNTIQYNTLKNSLIIHEENTKKNHKRVVSVYVIQIHVDLHKL